MRLPLPLFACFFLAVTLNARAQVTLGSSPYLETFDGITTTAPNGFTVRTGATASALGNIVNNIAKPSWTTTTGQFANFASATGLATGTNATDQANSTNRALGIRQTGAFGDPGAAFVFQVANTSGKTDFKLTFLLQSLDAASARTTAWKVDYAIGATPTTFLDPTSLSGDPLIGGTTFENNTITVDFGSLLNNKTEPVTIRIVALQASTGSGSRASSAIDDFKLSWASGPNTTPAIIINENGAVSFDFPATAVNTSSSTLSYTVRTENLTQPLDVTTTGPFTLSLDYAGPFTTSLSIPVAEVLSYKVIYVKYAPLVAESSVGSVINTSAGATTKTIQAKGQSFDKRSLTFTFNSCAGEPGSQFHTVNVRGAQVWACTAFGNSHGGSATNGVNINGFSSGAVDNEDWLISPALHISSIPNPSLSFYSKGEFNGPSLQLLVSTTYGGTGIIDPAQWTVLPATFAALTNTWTFTENIDLSAYASGPFFIAFKYLSSPTLGAARWTLDDVRIYDPAFSLATSASVITLPETSAGSTSDATPFVFKGMGYGDFKLTASANFQVSTNNTSFSQFIEITAAQAAASPTLYVRFAPSSKQLKVTGTLKASGTGIDSTLIALTASSYPKAGTLDIGAYNMSFFGSNANNNPTQGQITTQVNNLAIVYQRLNLDIIGVEEVSSDAAMDQLIAKLPGYASILSPRWSYSFDPPDPNFPPQKIGFIYNTATTTLVSSRVMFEGLYDSARLDLSARLNSYPTGTPSSFWASGRLPFMAVFNVNINGQMKTLRVIDIHSKSADDAVSYSRRVFDVKVLKDSLDAYYPNDNIILVGDFNDRLAGSITTGSNSPYIGFINDASNYTGLSYPLDVAGRVSFVTGTGLIDHIIISSEMNSFVIPGSTDIEDPRSYITGYNATTASDHLPIFSRFDLTLADGALPVDLLNFDAARSGSQVTLSWATASEKSIQKYILERAADGKNFTPINQTAGKGSITTKVSYKAIDNTPLSPVSYYRLKQVDFDGSFTYSKVISVNVGIQKGTLEIYPNPVRNLINLSLKSATGTYSGIVTGLTGQLFVQEKGSMDELNSKLNRKLDSLKPGVYMFQLRSSSELHSVRFIKQ